MLEQEEYMGKLVDLNNYHCNALIKGVVLSPEISVLLTKHGFTEYDTYWCKFKSLCDEIELFVYLFKDNSVDHVSIEIIDDTYGQPYDYQSMLEKNPNFEYALKVQKLVEKEISELQEVGILSGHVYGEYI